MLRLFKDCHTEIHPMSGENPSVFFLGFPGIPGELSQAMIRDIPDENA